LLYNLYPIYSSDLLDWVGLNNLFIPDQQAIKSNDVVTIVQLAGSNSLAYTFTVRAYVESYNFLRVMGGIANVVFSS
jgi:hypothetical protein